MKALHLSIGFFARKIYRVAILWLLMYHEVRVYERCSGYREPRQ